MTTVSCAPPSLDRPDDEPLLGEIAVTATVVAERTPCADVERLLHRRPELTSVVVARDAAEPEVVSRHHVSMQLAGRLGYGRTLHGRKAIVAFARPGTLRLHAAMPLSAAAQRALARDDDRRYDDILVRGDDGRLLVVTVAELLRHLALLHARRAVRDPLTGLRNRGGFMAALGAAMQDRTTSSAVLFIDLDDFKHVNDELGHAAGDALLRTIGERLRDAVRAGDVVGRLGGDEFAVLLPGVEPQAARETATRLLDRIARPMALADRTVGVTASAGLAVADAGASVDAVMRNADLAMYHAKHGGKARVAAYGAALEARASARFALRAALAEALARDELSLRYQPVVALADGRVVAVEALLRWQHPEQGELAPGRFLPLAEETGLIEPIGAWVVEEASRQLAQWRALPGGDRLRMGVNVSVRQLEGGAVGDQVAGAVARAGLRPEQLILEITESALVREPERVLASLREIRSAGFGIAIDDFGTGYSSFARLDQLPVTTLKLDRTFTARLDRDRPNQVMRGLLGLAEAMELEAIVEGIETADQVGVLRELGARLGQGYHYARPLAPEALAELLAGSPAPVR